MKTQDIAVIGICAALYAIVGISTANVSFFGIGFLPAVVIPAVFAVLYGPWVGGISGALGIFIRDMFVHGNAALSLVAGVPANFILFFLIGYISIRNISLKQALVGVIVATFALLFPTI
ncbi:MAG TPA: ECF transporter S component, partial [Alphaproteobacteria bacterium]|nr:ECF transporter S component [Alphaproteobacteria bacterium]